jgi:peptidoglycan/LPS O-acetylase OafA/YrhL
VLVSADASLAPASASRELTHSQPGYRPDIDGLRAVAVLAVLGKHIGLLPGGLVGVDVFFVISGYLISGIILGALARGSFSLLDFYARRVKRIFPALIAVLLTVSVVGWLLLLPDEYQRLGEDITEGATFTVNVFQHNPLYYGPSILLLDPLWSLGVEEQFYLFWPLLLLATARLGRRQFIVIVGTAAVSFVLNIVISYHAPLTSYQLPWTRLWELALGSALAYIHLHGVAGWHGFAASRPAAPTSRLQLYSCNAFSVTGAALIVAANSWHIDVAAEPGWWALAPCAGALLLISAGPAGLVNRYVLSRPAMVFIGLISYPLYLWHYPLLIGARIPNFGLALRWQAAALGATFILAFLTYKYVERPVRTARNERLLPAVLCATMAVCAGIGVLVFQQRITPRPEPASVSKFSRAILEDWLPGSRGTFWTRFPDGFLEIGDGPRRVLYVGDSNMQQYYPRIARVLGDHAQNTHRAVFAVRDQCAPGAIEVAETDDASRAACRAFMAHAFEYAQDPKIDTVVIAACWSCYFVPLPDILFVGKGKLKPGSDAALSNLERALQELERAHKRVYIVLDIPIGLGFDPHQMIVRTLTPPGLRVVVSLPERAAISQLVTPIGSRLRQLAQATGASVIDPLESLCDASTCPAVTPGGEPMYHDWWRLRPSFVRDNVRFLDGTIVDSTARAVEPRAQVAIQQPRQPLDILAVVVR